jgi:hypothetical protein
VFIIASVTTLLFDSILCRVYGPKTKNKSAKSSQRTELTPLDFMTDAKRKGRLRRRQKTLIGILLGYSPKTPVNNLNSYTPWLWDFVKARLDV